MSFGMVQYQHKRISIIVDSYLAQIHEEFLSFFVHFHPVNIVQQETLEIEYDLTIHFKKKRTSSYHIHHHLQKHNYVGEVYIYIICKIMQYTCIYVLFACNSNVTNLGFTQPNHNSSPPFSHFNISANKKSHYYFKRVQKFYSISYNIIGISFIFLILYGSKGAIR